MKCELAGRLIDAFMHDELNQRDREWMEEHLASCPRCAMELRKHPDLERQVRRSLAASVRPLYLSTDASRRIVQASADSLGRAGRAQRTLRAVRFAGAALAFVLVAVGVLALLGRIPVPSELQPVSLPAAKSLPVTEPGLEAVLDPELPMPRMATPAFAPLEGRLLIEPADLHPREPFTMTVYVQTAMAEPMERLDLDLDISGPTGLYHFELSFSGPLLAEGMSIYRVTPGLLAVPCEEQYLMLPTEIFAAPGAYTIRVTLMHPVVATQ